MRDRNFIRLNVILLFLFFFAGKLSAWEGIVINENFVKTPLTDVFKTLSSRYKIDFSYEPDAIAGVSITRRVHNLKLEQALALILEGTRLEFLLLSHRQVLIRTALDSTPTSPQKSLLRGWVKNKSNDTPLAYANVIIVDEQKGAVARKDGSFLFSWPMEKGKKIHIRVSHLGYQSEEKMVVLNDNITEIHLSLEPKEQALDVVDIKEKFPLLKSTTEISNFSLSPNRLTALPQLAGSDIFRSLHYLPGISSIDDASIGLSIRGGATDENLVILDGINLYNHDHFSGVFSAFNPDAISGISVYKSAFPAKFGGKTSGVVALEGKAASTEKFMLNAGANLLSAQAKVEVPLGKKASLLLAGRKSYNTVLQSNIYQSLIDAVGANETRDQQPASLPTDTFQINVNTLVPIFQFHDVNAKFRYEISPREQVKLTYFRAFDEMNYSTNISIPVTIGGGQQFRNENTSYDETKINQGANITWEKQWDNGIEHTNSLSYSHYLEQTQLNISVEKPSRDTFGFSGNLGNSDINRIQDLAFRSDFSFSPNPNHTLNFGTEVKSLSVSYRLDLDKKRQLTATNSTIIPTLYVEDRMRFNNALSLTVALRGNHYPATGKAYLSPRASLNYTMNDQLSFKMATGRYYQFAKEVDTRSRLGRGREFWSLADGNRIPVQSSNHFVVGGSYKKEGFLFDVEAYYKDIDGLVTYSTRRLGPSKDPKIGVNPEYIFYSNGKGASYGWDVMLQKSRGPYTGWLSYSYGKVFHQYDSLNRGRPFTAEEEPGHQVKLIHMLRVGNWDFSATYLFGSGRPYTDLSQVNAGDRSVRNNSLNADRLPDYHRVDVGATWHFTGRRFKGELGFSVFNILNRKNVKFRQYLFSFQENRNTQASPSPSLLGEDIQGLGITPNLYIHIDLK